MLQQTTVAAAAPRFEAFTRRWPTVEALAAAPEAEVMAAWAGLGYYARARNLLACARAVVSVHGGRFPADEAGLAALPGIGAYTAAAVAAIAHGVPAAVVDTNVMRVVARLAADPTPPPALRARAAAWLAPHVPPDRPGDFAQALMDLGATVCTPRVPRCRACPLAAGCRAHASGAAARLPAAPARRARPVRHGTAWWIESAGEVALVRRPPRGLLGGLLALPGTDWAAEPPRGAPPVAAEFASCPGRIRHVFTHFTLELSVEAAVLPRRLRPMVLAGAPLLWTPIEQLAGAGLPTLFARAADVALAWREGRGRSPCQEAA